MGRERSIPVTWNSSPDQREQDSAVATAKLEHRSLGLACHRQVELDVASNGLAADVRGSVVVGLDVEAAACVEVGSSHGRV